MSAPSYSPHIAEIIAWLRRCGVTVHEHAHELPDEVSGLYRSETREIFLNEPSAPTALRTIAHEAGHWLGYLIDERTHSYQRERQAFVYGWHVLRWFDAPITRAEWIRGHREHGPADACSALAIAATRLQTSGRRS